MVGAKEPIIRDGHITLGDAPGLGVEPDDAVCRQHVRPGTLYFGEPV